MNVGIAYGRVREEERLLVKESERSGHQAKLLYDEDIVFGLEPGENNGVDVVLARNVSSSRALYTIRFFEHYGVPTVNSYAVASTCMDKAMTSIALQEHGVPTPRTIVAFSQESALRAIDSMGYPCVLKPVNGSWARLLAKINDRDAAEAILEHKQTLGSYLHSIFYIQEYVKKPGRDIRAFFVGDSTICAIYRNSPHWITNTARGGKAANCPVTQELNEICCRAADAVGGGVLAMDVMETGQGLVVHEINDRMEFKNSIAPTGVNIPEKMIEYVISVAKK